MISKKLKRDVLAAANVTIIVLVAVLMVSASSVVILLVQGGNSSQGANMRRVNVGDVIKVDYIGKLSDGRVFDTSLYSVASDDARYPKSLTFQLRQASQYVPLQFTVGAGTMIIGFDQGVVGMTVGQTKVIAVPPEKGYGPMDPSKLKYVPLTQVTSVFEYMNYSVFTARYGEAPVAFKTVVDPTWHWEAIVLSADPNADLVCVMNSPRIGQRLAMYGEPLGSPPTGWYAEVTSIDSTANGGQGVIQVQHLLTPANAGKIKGVGPGASTFIVDMVDSAGGTFRMNYNGELVGVTIYFTVTMVAFVS